MNQVLLQAQALSKRFGRFVALDRVDLQIRANTIHSVIGPNGAGKTTLFHTLTGNLPASSGRIEFAGRNITRLPGYKRVAVGMARSFQVTELFQNLTVRENLRLAAQGRHMVQALNFWRPVSALREPLEIAEALLNRLGLERWAQLKAGELSHGQQRILEVGMAMAAKPKLLLLDEPTSGMGVDDIPVMTTLIRELGRDHTILLIEHNMNIVMNISDVVTVMAQGRVLVEGPPAQVSEDPQVRTAYLGEAL